MKHIIKGEVTSETFGPLLKEMVISVTMNELGRPGVPKDNLVDVIEKLTLPLVEQLAMLLAMPIALCPESRKEEHIQETLKAVRMAIEEKLKTASFIKKMLGMDKNGRRVE